MTVSAWNRQPGESRKAFAGFMLWLEDDRRSIRQLLLEGQFQNGRTVVYQWGQKWDWKGRGTAYDTWRARARLGEKERRLARAEEKVADIATQFIDKLYSRIKGIKPEDLTPNQLANMLRTLSDIQLKALGWVEKRKLELDGKIEVEDVAMRERLLEKLRNMGLAADAEDEE